ncbi:MAG: tripartite tricarboxylate transporter substrate binding protein [Sphaerochaeta sp.]|nr:tripartite tricarboxylate transporter substrate binding protein [Sphaerochaeta sp.]
MMARTIAPAFEEYLGVSVIVENMPGASSGVAAEYVAKQKADGYTLFACSSSMCVFSTSENSDITYKDLDMLIMPFTTHIPAVLVNAKSDMHTMEDFIAYVNNNKSTASTAGVGSTWHFPAILLADEIGASSKVSYVPYPSGKETTLAVARGEVDWSTCGIYQESYESISSGLVRPLAVLDSKPFDLKGYGLVPSVLDSIPGLDKYIDIIGGWRGFAVKKGTPDAVKAKLTEALEFAVNSESFVKLLNNNGLSTDSVLMGEDSQKLFEKSSRLFSYLLYDMGSTPRDPMKINVPRWSGN